MNALRVLVIGSGGRESALAWRLARDPECAEVTLARDPDGATAPEPRVRFRAPDALDELLDPARLDLVVIGPEQPLADGLADRLRERGLAVFGPGRGAARLEASKWFAKDVMRAARVPTARAERVESADALDAALGAFAPPYVLKADGLAAGKGVLVTASRAEALDFGRTALEGGRFGASGRALVIEEFLAGEEASVMAVTDGERFVLLPPARDYKRAEDGDRGPNTGGMGAYAPAPLGAALEDTIGRTIVAPVLAELARRGTPFTGALYCGLMIDGPSVRVVEFNARFGDPETQAVLPLVEGAFARLLRSAATGALEPALVSRVAGACVAVAIADERYPEAPSGAGRIAGLEALAARGLVVFHAGTRFEDAGWRITGGRAAYVVARDDTLAAARSRVYEGIESLQGHGWRARRDIAAAAGALAATGGRT